jgi:hypothetical protein
MTADSFSTNLSEVRPFPVAKVLDWGDRSSSVVTNQQQYTDSFNSTTSNSQVQGDTGNTTVTLGDSSGSGAWFDKLLPAVVLGALVIAALVALRSNK